MDDATAERHAECARTHVRSLPRQKRQKHPQVLFFVYHPGIKRAICSTQKARRGNVEGEPQVSPGVASLPVASGVRKHIVGIANRFQTQAFMQRYTWFAAPHYRW